MISIENLQNIWNGCLEHLRSRVKGMAYEMFLEPLVPVKASDGLFILGAEDEMSASWAGNYSNDISEFLKSVTGANYKVKIISGDEYKKLDAIPESVKPSSHRKSSRSLASKGTGYENRFNFRYTFDSFVVGACNRFAFGFSEGVANHPGEACNPLFIYGGSGLGKTHLLHAIGQKIALNNPEKRVICTSGEAFLNSYVNAISNRTIADFRRYYDNADVLLVDDVHFLVGKEGTQEIFFNIFNTLFSSGRQIVVTSDRPPRQLKDFTARMITRFEGGGTVEITTPDYETRLAILHRKQECQHLAFSEDVLAMLARKVVSSVRKLESTLFNLVSRCCIDNRDEEMRSRMASGMSVSEAESLLAGMLEDEEVHTVSVQQIQKLVAEHYDVRMADILGKARPVNIAFPRQIAMYLCRTLTSLSLPSIGEQFNRNHATILHAVEVIGERMKNDNEFRQEIQQLKQRLK